MLLSLESIIACLGLALMLTLSAGAIYHREPLFLLGIVPAAALPLAYLFRRPRRPPPYDGPPRAWAEPEEGV